MKITEILESIQSTNNTFMGTVKNKISGIEFDVYAAEPTNRMGERSTNLLYLVDKHTGKKVHKFNSTKEVEQYYDWIQFPSKFAEAATAGATSSGSIATVVNPGMTNKNPAAGSPGKMAKKGPPQWMPKKQTPQDNALNKNVGLMTGTPIKR